MIRSTALLLLFTSPALAQRAAPDTLRTFVLQADSGTALESASIEIDGPFADIFENWGTYYTVTRAGVDSTGTVWTSTRLFSVMWTHPLGPWVIRERAIVQSGLPSRENRLPPSDWIDYMPTFDSSLPDTVHITRYLRQALLTEFVDSLGTYDRPSMKVQRVDRIANDTLRVWASMSSSADGHGMRIWALRWYFFAVTDTGHRLVRYEDKRMCEWQVNISC